MYNYSSKFNVDLKPLLSFLYDTYNGKEFT